MVAPKIAHSCVDCQVCFVYKIHLTQSVLQTGTVKFQVSQKNKIIQNKQTINQTKYIKLKSVFYCSIESVFT